MIIEKLLKNFKNVYMHFIQKIPLKTQIPKVSNNNILNVHVHYDKMLVNYDLNFSEIALRIE